MWRVFIFNLQLFTFFAERSHEPSAIPIVSAVEPECKYNLRADQERQIWLLTGPHNIRESACLKRSLSNEYWYFEVVNYVITYLGRNIWGQGICTTWSVKIIPLWPTDLVTNSIYSKEYQISSDIEQGEKEFLQVPTLISRCTQPYRIPVAEICIGWEYIPRALMFGSNRRTSVGDFEKVNVVDM